MEMTIYDLKLHEGMSIDEFWILRVPGGWIYFCTTTQVFVPFNNEFQTLIQKTADIIEHLTTERTDLVDRLVDGIIAEHNPLSNGAELIICLSIDELRTTIQEVIGNTKNLTDLQQKGGMDE